MKKIAILICCIGFLANNAFAATPVTIQDSTGNKATVSGGNLSTYDAQAHSDATSPIPACGQSPCTTTIGNVGGAQTQGATVSGGLFREGCRAATAAPTAVTDGQAVDAQCGVEGKRVILPYTIKELAVRGSTGAVTTTSQTSIIASAGGSLRNYITEIECTNSGASTSILTFTDDQSLVLINPAGGGVIVTFPIPLRTAAATAFQVTPGTASTSQYCSAQGFTGL